MAGGWLASRWHTRAEVRRLRSWARTGTKQLTRGAVSTAQIGGVAAARRRSRSGGARVVIDGVVDMKEGRVEEGLREKTKEREGEVAAIKGERKEGREREKFRVRFIF